MGGKGAEVSGKEKIRHALKNRAEIVFFSEILMGKSH